MRSEGFWISPAYTVKHFDGPTCGGDTPTHISAVMQEPQRYGTTATAIKEAYARHKEREGSEEKARAEILTDVLRRGWTRVRAYPTYFSAEYWGSRKKERILRAINKVVGDFYGPYTTICLRDLENGVQETHFIHQGHT